MGPPPKETPARPGAPLIMMIDFSLLAPPVTWVCGRCNLRETRRDAIPEQRFHHCTGMSGLTMPMVREGERVKITAHAREDYVGTEDVPLVAGVPVMNVTTEHADGSTDVCVFAPTAYVKGDSR